MDTGQWPSSFWPVVSRILCLLADGISANHSYLIHDRDPLFTTEFQTIFASVGVTSVKLPPQSPNLNCPSKVLGSICNHWS
jgi:hypothetical protein